MKLVLNKQKILSLNSKEMSDIKGGGEARSDRRTGNCDYSRKHPEYCECIAAPGDELESEPLVTGCK